MITISKLGGSVVVDTGNRSQYLTLTNPSRSIIYDESNNTIDISIGDFHKNDLPLDQITIAGVVPTNKSEFDTQLALVFLDTDSGDGGSGLTSVNTDGTLTGDGTTGTPLGVTNPVTGVEINLWNDAASLAAGGTNRVVSGNAIWNTGLTFDIVGTIYSNLVYYILGTRYESSPTQVTLSAADPDNARIDVIYFDTTGNVGVLEGTPSADPVKPVVDSDTQVELTHVTVPANATEPVISGNLTVYDENTEFTGASTNGTVNFAATTAPSSGTKHISCGAFTNNQNINLTDGSLHDASTFQNLTFKLRLNAIFTNNAYLGFYFANGTSPVSNQVTVQNNTFGYVRTVTGSYQVVSIPMSAFVFTNTQFNRIYIVLHGTNATGFYLDAITLQGGVTVPASNGVQSFNSRTGNIIPQSGDYAVAQITGAQAQLSGSGFVKMSGTTATYVNPDTVANVVDYGADKTGVADSTAAINSAIASSGKKRIYFPAGTYLVTTSVLKASSQTNKRGIELASGMELFGDGIGNTIITCNNNTTGSISDTNWYPMFNGHTTSVSNVIIHDLEINGNRANQAIYNANPYSNPTGHDDLTLHKSIQGIFFYQGDNNQVYNVYSHACQGFGIEFYNSSRAYTGFSKFSQNGNGGVGYTNPTTSGIIENNLITDNNSDNIRIIGPIGVIVRGNELSFSGTNASAPNWFAGCYVGNGKQITIENNNIHDNSAYGLDIAYSTSYGLTPTTDEITMKGNFIWNNGNGGISISSITNSIISGNHIYKNGKKQDGTTDTHSNYNAAAIVGNNASNITISDNDVWEDTQNVQVYFIKKWGGSPAATYSLSKSIVQNNRVLWIADNAHFFDGDNGDNINIANKVEDSSAANVAASSNGNVLKISSGLPAWGAPITLTTTGTSGAASFSAGTLNIPNYGAAAGGAVFSALTAAAATNTIDNTQYKQEWQWSTLAGTDAVKLSSTSTAAASNAQTVLNIALSGANGTSTQTTYGMQVANTHTGTSSTNIAGYFTASGGTTNYSIQCLTGAVDVQVNGIGSTSTNGLILENTTAATSGAHSYSPRINLHGNEWKTNATAASQVIDAWIELKGLQGTANPIAQLDLYVTPNGFAAQHTFSLGSNGCALFTTASTGSTVRINGALSLDAGQGVSSGTLTTTMLNINSSAAAGTTLTSFISINTAYQNTASTAGINISSLMTVTNPTNTSSWYGIKSFPASGSAVFTTSPAEFVGIMGGFKYANAGSAVVFPYACGVEGRVEMVDGSVTKDLTLAHGLRARLTNTNGGTPTGKVVTWVGVKIESASASIYSTNNYGIWQEGTAAKNRLEGKLSVGAAADPSAFVTVAAGTTSTAQLNLASSTAPTSPNNGDIWFDGTNLKIQISGATKTVTVS